MAIVLDHQVYTAPVINGRIEDRGMINGNFSQESAQDLALVLRAGALPASIKYLEERTVGPSLGADSIREGVRASIGSIDRGDDFSGDLLPAKRCQCSCGPDAEPDHPGGVYGAM